MNIRIELEKLKNITSRNFKPILLGVVYGYPIYAYTEKNKQRAKKHVTITSLFHGNEQAGYFGLRVAIMLNIFSKFQNIKTTIIPIVNPTGASANTRQNIVFHNPNRGYFANEKNHILSDEGKLFISHKPWFKKVAKDTLISLHEDIDAKNPYVHINYSKKQNLHFEAIKQSWNSLSLMPMSDAEIVKQKLVTNPSYIVEPGRIENDLTGGSFEDYVILEKISYLAISTESPAHPSISTTVRKNLNFKYIENLLKSINNI